jgi:hypothetical protein
MFVNSFFFKVSLSLVMGSLILLGWFLDWGFQPVEKINLLKKESAFAYQKKEFKNAADKLSDLLKINAEQEQEEALINKGHSLFNLSDTTAKIEYGKLAHSQNNILKSLALQQNAVLLADFLKNNSGNKNGGEMLEEAINYCKESLRANPANAEVRYNYELLARLKAANSQNKGGQSNESEESQENQQQDENKEKDSEQKSKGQEEEKDGKKTESAADNFEKKPMSKDAAQMLLNAMKNSETQYLQQMKRKSSKPRDKSLPDW